MTSSTMVCTPDSFRNAEPGAQRSGSAHRGALIRVLRGALLYGSLAGASLLAASPPQLPAATFPTLASAQPSPASAQPAASSPETQSQPAEAADPHAARDAAMIQALLRLKGFDYRSKPNVREAVERELKRRAGTDGFLELVEKLDIKEADQQLLELALAQPDESLGVNAAVLLGRFGQLTRLEQALRSDDPLRSEAAATVLGRIGDQEAARMLRQVVVDGQAELTLRNTAVRGLGRSRRGQRMLLNLVEQGEVPEPLKFATANALHGSPLADVRERAEELLPLPTTAGQQTLPPLSQLVTRQGDAVAGQQVFAGAGTCAKCHLVAGQGKSVGPDLSEIGSKLSREALYVAILDPSAGISHNYESYALVTTDGELQSGLLVSQTESQVTIKNAEGIERTYARSDLEEFQRQPISLMPADLQKNLTETQLIDVVEYLTTLRKSDQ